MWTIAFFVGVILGGLVFAAGFGRVLLYNLFIRSLLVTIGTALTIIAARKATNIFINPASRNLGQSSPLGEVDLEEATGADDADEDQDQEDTGGPLEAEQSPDDFDEDEDIGELADMVSDTMSGEDEET